MSKTNVQDFSSAWSNSASLAAAGSATSGSFYAHGYARLVGIHAANASAKAGSGLRIWQGFSSACFDYFTDYVPSACSGSGFSIEIIAPFGKIDYITDSAASILRSNWALRPI